MLSFTTRGNFIDFKHIEDRLNTYSTHNIITLHNTSKCITWCYGENSNTISFTIDDLTYDEIPITSIQFDGVVMSSQADFKTGIESMFTGLQGGVLFRTTILTDAQIKAWADDEIDITPAPGASKLNVIHKIVITSNIAQSYTNIDGSATISPSYGATAINFFNTLSESPNNDVSNLLAGGAGSRPLVFLYPYNDATNTAHSLDDFENMPVRLLFDNNGSGVLTAGDAANTLKVTVYYNIADL